MKRNIAVLGSTGSIGTQTLEVIREHPDAFEVEALTAFSNADILIQQAIEFKPNAVVIGDKNLFTKVNDALTPYQVKTFAGYDSIEQVVEMEDIDLVVNDEIIFRFVKSQRLGSYSTVTYVKSLSGK